MSQIIPVPVQLNVEESINQFALGVSENSVQVSFGVSYRREEKYQYTSPQDSRSGRRLCGNRQLCQCEVIDRHAG